MGGGEARIENVSAPGYSRRRFTALFSPLLSVSGLSLRN